MNDELSEGEKGRLMAYLCFREDKNAGLEVVDEEFYQVLCGLGATHPWDVKPEIRRAVMKWVFAHEEILCKEEDCSLESAMRGTFTLGFFLGMEAARRTKKKIWESKA